MFDWDLRKAQSNRRKHGVSFEEAQPPSVIHAVGPRRGAFGDRTTPLPLAKSSWRNLLLMNTWYREEKMKKSRVLSAPSARAGKNDQGMKSKKFSDIPELSDRQLSSMRRVGRPTVGEEPRKLVAIRLNAKVLAWLRKTGKKKGLPYPSLINEILADAMWKAS